MNWITKEKTILFSPKFNKPINKELLSNCSNIIFSNFMLNDDLFFKYKNNEFSVLAYIGSIYNLPVNDLPNGIVKIIFGEFFN